MVHEEAAAYALDALDRTEVEVFERHLEGCRGCGHDLEELRFAAAALAFALESPVPRGSLRLRVLDAGAPVVPLPRRRRPTLLAAATVAAACAVVVAAVRPWDTGDAQVGFRRYAAGANATLLVGRSGEAVLAARRLPPPAAGTVYELWVIHGGRPQPAGLFRGRLALLTRAVPAGATVAVSLEPAGGSPQPTGPLLLHAETT